MVTFIKFKKDIQTGSGEKIKLSFLYLVFLYSGNWVSGLFSHIDSFVVILYIDNRNIIFTNQVFMKIRIS